MTFLMSRTFSMITEEERLRRSWSAIQGSIPQNTYAAKK